MCINIVLFSVANVSLSTLLYNMTIIVGDCQLLVKIPSLSNKTSNLLIIPLICAPGRCVLHLRCKYSGFGLNSNTVFTLLTCREDTQSPWVSHGSHNIVKVYITLALIVFPSIPKGFEIISIPLVTSSINYILIKVLLTSLTSYPKVDFFF